jgi:hypothetical protein
MRGLAFRRATFYSLVGFLAKKKCDEPSTTKAEHLRQRRNEMSNNWRSGSTFLLEQDQIYVTIRTSSESFEHLEIHDSEQVCWVAITFELLVCISFDFALGIISYWQTY